MVTQDLRATRLFGRAPAAGLGAQLALLALLWAGVCLSLTGWLTGVAYAVVTWAVLTSALRRSRTRSFGLANGVTLARAILVGGVTALVADEIGKHESVTTLIVIAAIALVLDGVDGQVARRTGTVSSLGARFDMEVDAFLILVLSIFVARSLGVWVLAIGAMRYAFVAASWMMSWLRSPLPPSLARKAVAAVQGVVLVTASSGLLPRPAAIALVAVALALLTWSFGRDIGWLWRTRHSTGLAGAGSPADRAVPAVHGPAAP